jgi:hypothetical protein
VSLKSNNLRADGAKALAEGLKGNIVITELDISSNMLGWNNEWLDSNGRVTTSAKNKVKMKTDMSGVIALANSLPDMVAMKSLNLASNKIDAEGAKHIAGALKVSKYILAVILVPTPCPSDHYFHCWCLLLSTGHGDIDKAQFV